jgi:glycosyltransferase involved in cell wall biosynthesis
VNTTEGLKIAILIATFNGEQYLEEQLESLLSQKGVPVDLIVNDDGSADRTIDILKEHQNRGLIKEIFQTQNVGPSLAFLNLLKHSTHYDFVALCDQDDLWDTDKIKESISHLGTEIPEIAVSERRYIDYQGHGIGSSPKIMKPLCLRNALVENVAYGNTIVLNSKASSLTVRAFPIGVDLDHWIYLAISAIGQVNHIPRPLISYRLHDSNHVGTSRLKAVFSFPKNLRKIRHSAKELLSNYPEELSFESINTLQNYLRIWSTRSPFLKIKAILKCGLYRQNNRETLVYGVGVLFASFFRSNLNRDFE